MKKNIYDSMMKDMTALEPKSWADIYSFLQNLKKTDSVFDYPSSDNLEYFSSGIAFLTYDYGIDGVSVEISKYAKSLEAIFSEKNRPDIHLIGGDFHKGSASVLLSRWKKFRLFGANGWDKWDKGKWFKRLFLESWDLESNEPDILSQQIWKMTISLIERLGHYVNQNKVNLFIPVNIFSNPGNIAFSIAAIVVSEYFGIPVLNSNHDFYWEGGKPSEERKDGEEPGIRDHFFTNHKHDDFFKLFKALFPWNGRKSIQVNINKEQSSHLINNLGFEKKNVFELSTSLSDMFFNDFTNEDVRSIRLRMAHILSDGNETIIPKTIDEHLKSLKDWMKNQKPVVCSAAGNRELDLTKDIVYFLQPTRIIGRKRIEKDIQLISSLLNFKSFLSHLKKNNELSVFLHITGPVPIEHEEYLISILNEFKEIIKDLDDDIAERIFIGFSVGNEDHRIFIKKGFKRLSIEDIYHLANIILFPSETEGRGLPIIESSAAKIPIICSRYSPHEVFDDVVGANLDPSLRIKFIPFPEEKFSNKFLKNITSLIFDNDFYKKETEHNREAVKQRFSQDSMQESFKLFLNSILNIIKQDN